jgi:uncharacterized protein with PQ loop repeat
MVVSQLPGIVGTIMVIAGYVPQVRHLIKERCSAGVSTRGFALWCASSMLFLVHAVVLRDAVFVIVQVLSLVANGSVVFYARRYRGQFCPVHGGTSPRPIRPKGNARSSG